MTNILLIDDDKKLLRVMELTVENAGYNVVTCTSAEEGLAQLDAQPPDLIVADLMMRHMTGYEFCQRVRARPDAKDIPIIIHSSRFQEVDKQAALEAGATDYLPKNQPKSLLLKRIEELLPTVRRPAANMLIGFLSLRGGTGVTSLTVNSALAATPGQEDKTVVLDLESGGGHAALLLGMQPSQNVVNAFSTIEGDLTLNTLAPYLMPHGSGLALLASGFRHDYQLSSYHSRLEQLIVTLKAGCPLTFVDLSQIMLEPRFAAILRSLDKLALILTPDIPSLQSTVFALQDLARLDVSEKKIVLVVNHVAPDHALPTETIEKAIKRTIDIEIPYEPEMIKAVNSGQPLLVSSPNCAGAAAITRLTRTLLA